MNALKKQTFLSGVRQKWTVVLIALWVLVLFIDKKSDINPEPYLNFLQWIGVTLIVGLSASAWNKEKAELK